MNARPPATRLLQLLSVLAVSASVACTGSERRADAAGDAGDSGAAARARDIPSFAAPTWRSPHGFESIASIRELPDGRVLVADVAAPSLVLLDSLGHEVRTVGRKGRGPGEYLQPRSLLALPGDTTLLVDPVARRMLVIAPTGDVVRTASYLESAGASVFEAQGDDGGIVYFELNRITVEQPKTPMVALARWRVGEARPESIAVLRGPASTRSVEMDAQGREGVLTVRMLPFSPRDGWAVAADGALAIVRADPFRVEWHLAGRLVEGPVQPVVAVPLSVEERTSAGKLPLPESKPAFRAGFTLADPFGRLWVLHHARDGSLTQRWTVFDRRGVPVASVEQSSKLDFTHATARGIYATRYDEDGLPTLEFFTWK